MQKQHTSTYRVALAGNPNVGKSTVFNALTGMHQHTGNWAGKTVALARGSCQSGGNVYELTDLPGTYSLLARSAEEAVTRDHLCFGDGEAGPADAVLVVCDLTALSRNLTLLLQILEITPHVGVCLNFANEAGRRRLDVHAEALTAALGIPAVALSARARKETHALFGVMDQSARATARDTPVLTYPAYLEEAVAALLPYLTEGLPPRLPARFAALRLLEGEESWRDVLFSRMHLSHGRRAELEVALAALTEEFLREGRCVRDDIAQALRHTAERICRETVSSREEGAALSAHSALDRRLDRVFTGRLLGFPIMFCLLLFLFWLTVSAANVPSRWLSSLLLGLEQPIAAALTRLGLPDPLCRMLTEGAWRVLAWVVSVMLPPMAIFFPLFTLLEDAGYLPRVAFNLDRCFRRCHACGKQAMTVCMGFGCNAAGVTGCRIIDSPRERLIAVLTNVFTPCNGRLPMMIAVITVFLAAKGGSARSFLAALLLAAFILLGFGATFFCSWLLSRTLLRGVPSAFTLELPPYRRPQIGKVIVRSLFDRTLFVLGRAAAVAAPAGLLLWLCANLRLGGASLLQHGAELLDPLGRLMGLDGVILVAFLFGFPAAEIVIPIMLMIYGSLGAPISYESLDALRLLLVENGWTPLTAVCFLVFTLMHFPCSTTCLTIRKETGSWRWTAVAVVLPTLLGTGLCMLIRALFGG